MCGGNRIDRKGYFLETTIFSDVKDDMKIAREEIFGPVVCAIKFSDTDEVIKMANDTSYGLAAGIWTKDQERAERVAGQIDAGTVYVNHYRSVDPASPIGGVKRSGYGRELGPDAIADYLQTKSIWTGTAPVPNPFPD